VSRALYRFKQGLAHPARYFKFIAWLTRSSCRARSPGALACLRRSSTRSLCRRVCACVCLRVCEWGEGGGRQQRQQCQQGSLHWHMQFLLVCTHINVNIHIYMCACQRRPDISVCLYVCMHLCVHCDTQTLAATSNTRRHNAHLYRVETLCAWMP
jgi:hypothetical protein